MPEPGNSLPLSPTGMWLGPRLLVPMALDALVVTNPAKLNRDWSILPMLYNQLQFFESIEPDPIFDATGAQTPPAGITLHWSLPSGVTHGIEDSSHTIVFPRAPNRWLILRQSADPQAKGGKQVMGWVLQSDYLGNDASTPFPYPDDPTQPATNIGLAFTLQNWAGGRTGLPLNTPFQLTAVSAGDATFAAYTANLRNVFSFVDPLDAPLNNTGPITLTYLVLGWYADPTADPLLGVAQFPDQQGWQTGQQWLQVMNALGWWVGGDHALDTPQVQQAVADARQWLVAHGVTIDPSNLHFTYPAQTLCHGMVYDVVWSGIDHDTPNGAPSDSGETIDIAVGNTAVDALGALIQLKLGSQYQNVGDVWEAFQYQLLNELNQAGGQASLLQKIRQEWFGNIPGGTLWELVQPQNPNPTQGKPREPIPLDSQLQGWLGQLNDTQASLDSLAPALVSQQGELFRLWWKSNALYYYSGPKPPIAQNVVDAAIAAYKASVGGLLNTQIPALQDALFALILQICQHLGGTASRSPSGEISYSLPPDGLQLAKDTRPRYWQPNPPVVLISGAQRSYKHGEDQRFTDDGTLFCRFSGQTVTGLSVNGAGVSGTVTNQQIGLSLAPNAYIPAEALDLLIETFFLDTTNAAAIGTPLQSPPSQALIDLIRQEQTLIWNADLHADLNKQTLAEQSGLVGVIPSLVGVALWSPPWSPLYLDWQATWFPTATDPQHALSGWSFDETIDDYTLSTDPNLSNRAIFLSRTLLTPQATADLAATLEKFLADHANTNLELRPAFLETARLITATRGEAAADTDPIEVLKAIYKTIKNLDLLSQSLSGLNELLVGQDVRLHVPPGSDIAALVQSQDVTIPYLPTIGGKPLTTGFNPIRAGHLQLNKLWVVDDFGQVFDPVGSQTSGQISPIMPDYLVTTGHTSLMQQAPRVMQPAQLDFSTIPALVGGDDPNPVCGWVLPNYLDRGLSIYDNQGQLSGELILVGVSPTSRLVWEAAPDTSAVVGAPPEISNPFLLAFVNNLLSLNDDGQSFNDLLELIDTALWTVDPLGGRGNQNLAVLVGRPLALVRARLRFNLAGPALIDQNWAQTGKNNNQGFTAVSFTIHLGSVQLRDDGLVGYFLNDAFQRIHAVYPLNEAVTGYVVYEDIALPFDGETSATVTMLLDPRGDVHAQTGALPDQVLAVPDVYVDQPIANMRVTFRAGPLITEPARVRMPIPANIDGKWAWVQHSGITILETAIEKADDRAAISDIPLIVREGWLKLSDFTKRPQ